MNNHNTPPNARKQRARDAVANHTPTGSWQAMEEDARHHIARRHIAENSAETPEATKDQHHRQELFIKRARAENDRAEYELFGSRGHTYHDPETGEVIADAQNPTIGLIERMRTELTYGQGEAERNAYADAYESRIMSLVNDDGLELAQAQLIADFEQKDAAKRGKLIAERINNGESDAVKAAQQVDAQLARLAQKRQEVIVNGGALTVDDYTKLWKGKDLYADSNTQPEPPTPEQQRQAEDERTRVEVIGVELEKSRQRLAEARRDYEEQRVYMFGIGRKKLEEKRATVDALCDEVVQLEIQHKSAAMKDRIDRLKQQGSELGLSEDEIKDNIATFIAAEAVKADYEAEDKTIEARQKGMSERSRLRKTIGKIGAWFTRGSDAWVKSVKQGGAGLVVGGATGLASGISFPISAAVGISSALLVGELSRQGQLQENAARKYDTSDECRKGYIELVKAAISGIDDTDAKIDGAYRYAYKSAAEESGERNRTIHHNTRMAMSRYAIGFYVGNGVGSVINHLSGGFESSGVHGSTGAGNEGLGGGNTGGIGTEGSSVNTGGVGGGGVESLGFDYNAPTVWDAVLDATGGDATATYNALLDAVANTPGAEWHSLGVNGMPDATSWISVNGISETAPVLQELAAHLTLPK